MRIPLVFFSLLLTWSCWAQPAPINRRAMVLSGLASQGILTPPQISPGMFRWWVSSDVPSNVVVSNYWLDRIVSDRMWQMNTTIAPTNGPAGIRFNGTQSVTNRVIGYDIGSVSGEINQCDIFYFIFTPDGAAGEEQIFTDASVGNRGPGMNGTNLRYTGLISGGPNTICALAAGTTNDVVMVLTPTNTIWFTNGVVCRTNVTVTVDDFNYGRMGIGTFGNYNGSIFENGIWSNKFFTVSLVSQIHKYATNTYKYSP